MRIIVRRLTQLVVVVMLVSLFSFFLLTLVPGDPVVAIVGFSSAQQRDVIRHELHLDDSIPVRYVKWLGDFVRGDMGTFYRGPTGRDPVYSSVKTALPVSLLLMLYAMLLTLLIAIPLGVFAAYRSGTWFDKLANASAFGFISLPDFALGFILSYWIGVKLHWLPSSGYIKPGTNLVEHLKHMALPAISLAAGQIAGYMRLLRSDMISTLQEDFVTVAKAKGMSTRRILWRHALRPSSLTLLTVAGLNIGALIGGTVVVELVFDLPGMGFQIASAIGQRQYVAIQSFVAIIAIGYVVINVLVDLLYTALDPRIRHARALA
jgi:peptide/nickel transport system permease protein